MSVQPHAGTLGLALDLHRKLTKTARNAGLSFRAVGNGVPQSFEASNLKLLRSVRHLLAFIYDTFCVHDSIRVSIQTVRNVHFGRRNGPNQTVVAND